MKKLAAILLVLLLLFNLIGYRLWFYYVQQRADAQLIAALDKERYNEADLITIAIPLSMPYQTEQTGFERIDGEISYHGIIYKYVKRKVQNGTLILRCLPDHRKAQLETAKDNFFGLANNLTNAPVKKPANSNTVSVNNLISEYDSQSASNWAIGASATPSTPVCSVNENQLPTSPLTILEQPPDVS